jgi:putative membrane protein
MGPHYYFDGWGFGLVWALLNFLFWAALVGLAIWTVMRLSSSGPPPRYATGPGPQAHHRESPREILDRRFAFGEIDAATYEDMRARLEGARPKPGPAVQAAAAPPPTPDERAEPPGKEPEQG